MGFGGWGFLEGGVFVIIEEEKELLGISEEEIGEMGVYFSRNCNELKMLFLVMVFGFLVMVLIMGFSILLMMVLFERDLGLFL